MGAVHGVYLKYVGLSALSYAGYSLVSGTDDDSTSDFSRLVLGYSALLNGAIAILFKMEWGMQMIGKNKSNGKIPPWSYALFFPFHIPTFLYTHIHTKYSKHKVKDSASGKMHYEIVPVATEVYPGWWVGGCYGHELGKDWGGVIDLTVEFPESCIGRTNSYLSAPTWDGVPLPPSELDRAATFGVDARKEGDVLVHCAHGRGRSTTVMCACLVKAGLFPTWQEAFENVKKNRNVCKLNKRMRQNLTAWQALYVDGKKAT